MFRLAVGERDDVETKITAGDVMLLEIDLSGFDKIVDLAFVHSFGRMPVGDGAGAFYFDKYKQIVLSNNQVDLFVSGSPIASDQFKPLSFQQSCGFALKRMPARYPAGGFFRTRVR